MRSCFDNYNNGNTLDSFVEEFRLFDPDTEGRPLSYTKVFSKWQQILILFT